MLTLIDHPKQFGWVITNGVTGFAAGWFKSSDDRIYYASKLRELFPETEGPLIPPLLLLYNSSKVDSDSYNFAVSYLEKYLDSQEDMDIHRSLKIHEFVKFVVQGSMTREYDIQKRFEAAACQPQLKLK